MNENKNPWKIEYKDEPWSTVSSKYAGKGVGYYKIMFNDMEYGFFTKDSFDDQSIEYILTLITRMLNDAHDLALQNKDK